MARQAKLCPADIISDPCPPDHGATGQYGSDKSVVDSMQQPEFRLQVLSDVPVQVQRAL
jgi:hypothetical protein